MHACYTFLPFFMFFHVFLQFHTFEIRLLILMTLCEKNMKNTKNTVFCCFFMFFGVFWSKTHMCTFVYTMYIDLFGDKNMYVHICVFMCFQHAFFMIFHVFSCFSHYFLLNAANGVFKGPVKFRCQLNDPANPKNTKNGEKTHIFHHF